MQTREAKRNTLLQKLAMAKCQLRAAPWVVQRETVDSLIRVSWVQKDVQATCMEAGAIDLIIALLGFGLRSCSG